MELSSGFEPLAGHNPAAYETAPLDLLWELSIGIFYLILKQLNKTFIKNRHL